MYKFRRLLLFSECTYERHHRCHRIDYPPPREREVIPSGGSFRFAVQSAGYQLLRARVISRRRTGGLLGVPTCRYPYSRLCSVSRCCFSYGDTSKRQQSWRYRGARLQQSAQAHTLLECGVHRLAFRMLPCCVGGQAASGGQFGICSVPTDSYALVGQPVTQTSSWETWSRQLNSGPFYGVTARIHGVHAVVLRLFCL